jgi:hypothetical protein
VKKTPQKKTQKLNKKRGKISKTLGSLKGKEIQQHVFHLPLIIAL